MTPTLSSPEGAFYGVHADFFGCTQPWCLDKLSYGRLAAYKERFPVGTKQQALWGTQICHSQLA
eukprot:11219083-Lingulodinium_polyedra.AAC.1